MADTKIFVAYTGAYWRFSMFSPDKTTERGFRTKRQANNHARKAAKHREAKGCTVSVRLAK